MENAQSKLQFKMNQKKPQNKQKKTQQKNFPIWALKTNFTGCKSDGRLTNKHLS